MTKTVGALLGISFIAFATQATVAWAQATPPVEPARAPGQVSWSFAGGRDTVALRDIARTGVPVDDSPVAWRGHGPSFLVQHMRAKGRRVHRVEFIAARAGHFQYKTPLDSVGRPEADSFSRVEARYEYRRYLFSNVFVRGLDIGAGLQGGGARWSLARHISGGIETGESRLSFVSALVTAIRFRRESRFGVEVNWANGGHIGRSSERHTADPAATRHHWGGGWLTDLVMAADVSISRHAAVVLQYVRVGDGLLSSHRSVTNARRSLALGVLYAK